MPEFRNMEQVEAYLKTKMDLVMKLVGEKVSKVLREYVKKNWYEEHSPSSYFRTMDFLNSITVGNVTSVGNSYQVEIYFDPDKIEPMMWQEYANPTVHDEFDRSSYKNQYFNAHMSLGGSETWQGKPISEQLPFWLEYGQNSRVHAYGGGHFVRDTKKFLEETNYHLKEIQKLLKTHGIDVVISGSVL